MYLYLFLFSVVNFSNAVIYDLNETEYNQMPPLFLIDDDYRSCLYDFHSQYCMARFNLFAETPNNLITLIKEYSEYTTKHYNHSTIDRGVCLATTCKRFIKETEKENNSSKHKDIEAILEECINDSLWNKYELKANLSQLYYCDDMKNEIKYDWSDWLLIAVLIAICSINIIGTLFDILNHKTYYKSNKKMIEDKDDTNMLLCFSLFTNWRYMISMESEDNRFDSLKGLYGLRAVTALIMPIAHAVWLIACGFTDNPRDFEKSSESIHYRLIFNGMMIVQIFFTMSGFLMVYILQVLTENGQSIRYLAPRVLIYRWLRLTPMNALMIFFSATWLRHLGSGPLWNMNVTSVANDCRRFWWVHLLYFNNYVPEDRLCAIQSWHLAADTQMFILGVIVYITLKGARKLIPLMMLLILSMVAPALHVWYQDLDGVVILKPEFYRNFINDTFRKMHILGHTNFSAFVIGMMAAYLTYYWQKNRINIFQHKIWKFLTWCTLPAMIVVFSTGDIFYVDGERPSAVIRILYAALHRSVIGVLTAFLILALVFKVENIQRSIFEWKGWVVPSKLSYCTNLLHVNIIHVIQGSGTQLGHVSFFYVIINYLGVMALSYLIAIPCYLMVEAPFSRLNKTFFQRLSQAKASVKKTT